MKTVTISAEVLLRMGVPELYWNCRLSNIPDECEHKKYVNSYLYDLPAHIENGLGLFLCGPYGSGKTAISCIILKAVALLAKTGLFIRCENITKAVLDKERFDSEFTMSQRLRYVDVLVLDELIVGVKNIEDMFVEDLIRERINSKKVTIITSNLAISTIQQQHQALYSVLLESVIPLKIDGYNFREAIKNEHKHLLKG